MKLRLSSAGIKNPSIQSALVELLGKPIAESDALCIPTAAYGHPQVSPEGAWRFISGQSHLPMTGLGWKSVGVLELTALPSIDEERWVTCWSARLTSCWWRAAMPSTCATGCGSPGWRTCFRRSARRSGWD